MTRAAFPSTTAGATPVDAPTPARPAAPGTAGDGAPGGYATPAAPERPGSAGETAHDESPAAAGARRTPVAVDGGDDSRDSGSAGASRTPGAAGPAGTPGPAAPAAARTPAPGPDGPALRRGGSRHLVDLDVAVVGGGIAGLAAAHRLTRVGRQVVVFEAGDRVGGRMASTRVDGWLVDDGAETIAARGYEATWRLIREAGVPQGDIVPIGPGFAVWRDGRAHAHLGHPRGLLTGAGMSWRGRLSWLRFTAALMARRAGYDPDRPEAAPSGPLTVAEQAAGFHPDVYDYVLQPLASHCFGWRPDRSAAAPLVASMLSAGGVGARWMTYTTGMDTLARALAARVPVRLGHTVQRVTDEGGAVRVTFDGGGELRARQVLLAVPAPLARTLYPQAPSNAAAYLRVCGYVPMLKVTCLLDRPLPSPTRSPSYALSVPHRESAVCAGLLLDHLKEPGRAPEGKGLATVFVSPWASPELIGAPDAEVAAAVLPEAERFVPGLAAATLRTLVQRFRYGLPEATPDALARRAAFAERPPARVEFAGDWVLLRPSSEGAVRSGELAARRMTAFAAAAAGRPVPHPAPRAVPQEVRP